MKGRLGGRRIAVALAAIVAACSPQPQTPEEPARASSAVVSISPSPLASPIASPTVSPSSGPAAGPTPTPQPSPASVIQARVLHERRVGPAPKSVADRAWEPVVATHPTDPRRIAVVYEHRGPGAGCSINPVIRISRDGGRTWRSTPSRPGSTSRRGMGLHAALAWGPGPRGATRLYWANMTTPGCGNGRFSLTTSYSDDEGRTWSRLRVERATPPWVGGFPEIAVDRDPQSPNHGTVYVGYNWLGRGAHGPGFRLLASADFGRSWRRVEIRPVRLASGARDWWRIAYRLRPAPDGSVYATWYQVDLRRWDRSNIFAKGGSGNVRRLGVAVARVRFDPETGGFDVGRPRIAVRVGETAWTTSGASASGTAGNIRPDPMWQYGVDVDAEGHLHVAVGMYGPPRNGQARGTIRIGRSDDGGRTWSASALPGMRHIDGRRQSSLRPNLVAGPGYVLVTLRSLDDVRAGATMGTAYALSTDGGATWVRPTPVNDVRWSASTLDGVVNGAGLRERAERTADGDVVWVYGDGRLAVGAKAGRTAIFATRIDLRMR
jgi:hypothetical protein